jgi:hypothetical protein
MKSMVNAYDIFEQDCIDVWDSSISIEARGSTLGSIEIVVLGSVAVVCVI